MRWLVLLAVGAVVGAASFFATLHGDMGMLPPALGSLAVAAGDVLIARARRVDGQALPTKTLLLRGLTAFVVVFAAAMVTPIVLYTKLVAP